MTSLTLTTTRNAADRDARLTSWTRVLCVLFFFSGFPALIYQLTWQRALFLHLRRQYRVGDHRRHRLHARARPRKPRRRLAVEAARHPALAAAGGDRTADRRVRLVSLTIFDKVGEFTIGLSLPATAAVSLALVVGADAADGRDPAGSGQPSRPPLRQYRKRGRLALLRQHARRRRGLPRVRGAAVSVPRHERLDLCRGRDERRGRSGRARRALARQPRRASPRMPDTPALPEQRAPRARAGDGAGARGRRRLRFALVRNLLLPHGVLC